MINFEGGAIPEEYHTAYIVDRVNTTGTVWLGLTVACAQCHDHKYDPITQKEFYQLYAFFNNVPENGLDGTQGERRAADQGADARPGAAAIGDLAAEIAAAEQRLSEPTAGRSIAAQAAWEKTALAKQRPSSWKPLTLEPAVSKGGATLKQLDDKSMLRQRARTRRPTPTS